MASAEVGNSFGSPVLNGRVNKKSDICECCKELKLELGRTLLELSSAQEIIKLLQEERNLKWCERTSEGKSYHEEIPTRIEGMKGKEDTWTQVNKGRHKISRRPEIKCAQPVLRSVNEYELQDNLNELMNVTKLGAGE
jgi:hypothetical protein